MALPFVGWWTGGPFDLDQGCHAAIDAGMPRRREWETPSCTGAPWHEKPILASRATQPFVAPLVPVNSPRVVGVGRMVVADPLPVLCPKAPRPGTGNRWWATPAGARPQGLLVADADARRWTPVGPRGLFRPLAWTAWVAIIAQGGHSRCTATDRGSVARNSWPGSTTGRR
ncbi:MAG: hypothetical protein HYX65_07160 [Gemmatimonadetes bacterium]|nr:hypothetical protein [Gemmatimonadota bacterium]